MAEGSVDRVDIEDRMNVDEVRSIIERIIEASDREGASRALVMVHRYAIGDSLERVGKLMGVSRERVRQVINTTDWPMSLLKEARSVLDAEQKRDQARAAEILVL